MKKSEKQEENKESVKSQEVKLEVDKLNFENLIDKIFSIINYVFCCLLVLSPLIVSFVCLIGSNIDIGKLLVIIYALFCEAEIVNFILHIKRLKLRVPDLLEIITILLLIILVIAECISKKLNLTSYLRIGLFVVVFLFYRLDKKYYKKLVLLFIIVITICSIMGLCDLNNSYMPGFDKHCYPMSLQFFNPNYSAAITSMAIIICMYVLYNFKTTILQFIMWYCYCVLNVALFINGCFTAETAVFLGQIFLFIFIWIKNKKCPWVILLFFTITFVASFIRVPGKSTSFNIYIYEALAFIDGKLGTNLLYTVSTFFNRLFGISESGINSVIGSDGHDRSELLNSAINSIFENEKSILIGRGTGYNYRIHVHNVYFQIWLEHGIFTLAFYLATLIIIFIRLFKAGFKRNNIFLITLTLVAIFVIHNLGCLEYYSFPYFVAFLSVLAKMVNLSYYEKRLKKKTLQLKLDDNAKLMGQSGSASRLERK